MDRIRKGDEVVVLAGKDKGKRGVVLRVLKDESKVVVENINMVKRHTKGNPLRNMPGGIVEKESPLPLDELAALVGRIGRERIVDFIAPVH